MSEPTPGPYEARGSYIIPAAHKDRPIGYSGDAAEYAEVLAWTAPCRETTDEDLANARLLAASWEMREALAEIASMQREENNLSVAITIAARALAKIRNKS